MPAHVRQFRRRQRGQAAIETVLALLLLCLIFFALVQITYLYMGQMIAHHTVFVMARSYVVGFNERIVHRAREVGSIGMAGHLEQPEAYATRSPGDLGAVEEDLIAEFLSTDRYTLWYQYWDRISGSTPVAEAERIETFRVQVWNYPLVMPMRAAYLSSDSVDFGSNVDMYNHAAYFMR